MEYADKNFIQVGAITYVVGRKFVGQKTVKQLISDKVINGEKLDSGPKSMLNCQQWMGSRKEV